MAGKLATMDGKLHPILEVSSRRTLKEKHHASIATRIIVAFCRHDCGVGLQHDAAVTLAAANRYRSDG